jgi:hypothetical protein
MPYNFELAVSARISKSVAEEMIRRVVEEQTGKKVASIDVKLNKVSRGIGPAETTETVFDGFHIFFTEESTTTPGPAKQGFVKASYQ